MRCECWLIVAWIAFASPSAFAQTKSTKYETPPSVVRTADRLRLVGALLLGAGYLPALGMGVISVVDGVEHFQLFCGGDGFGSDTPCPRNDAIVMLIPVAGPVAYSSASDRDHVFRANGNPSTGEQIFLVTDGLLQATGLGMICFAALYSVANTPDAPLTASHKHADTWTVTPNITTNRVELGATYRF